MPDFTIDNPTPVVFKVNRETRTIRGLAVPFGDVATNGWASWTFAKETLAWTKVKVLDGHDWAAAVGTATLEETDAGIVMAAKIAKGARGDAILDLATPDPDTGEAVYDGLSIGLADDVVFDTVEGVNHVKSATIREVSLTPLPAFERAQITSVAASAARNTTGGNMPDQTAADTADQTATADAAPVTFDQTAVVDAIAAGFSAIADTARPVVPAGAPVAGQITEADPYRFDGIRGAHDFSADLISAMGIGPDKTVDVDAYQRVLQFMGEKLGPKFVTTTDTAAINPTGYRADMFVDYQKLSTPLRNAFYKGALTDVTPFSFSKFNTATGLVGDHTQGTEPTPGTFTTAVGATITPAPVSGKVHITREVADQGGNPQVSAMIWNRIQYDYLQAMETKAAALLSAASPAELGAAIVAAANTVANLAVPIESALAGLNFVAGGDRFDFVAAHLDLYLAMANLKDGQSRPYYPILNPVNAQGTTRAGYKALDVAGTTFQPVWSLGTVSDGTPHKSYVIDTDAVYFWHSAPQRLDRLQEKVEGYDLGVWGYWAGIIADASGLKKITYDPV